MKKKGFLVSLLLIFGVELAALFVYAAQEDQYPQDAVEVNAALQSVKKDWSALESHQNQTSLDYVVLDAGGDVIYKTRSGLSESIHAAVAHRDTILDAKAGGKLILYNDSTQLLQAQRHTVVLVLLLAAFLQSGLCIGYYLFLGRTIIKPFGKLKGFAERIAGGNLDIPLEMDRQNLFGAFTESFDIMRAELKKARMAEAEANASKKELVAKLSHDIKTPVASIKAASEVGAALAENERSRDNYTQIIRKADQIDALITNLFSATLEELQQLPVTPADIRSMELEALLESADYLHRAAIPAIPECLLYADKLRLQQVFDNIFSNSYKYAGTRIEVAVRREGNCLAVIAEDYGGGVSKEELPLLKEKFRRGRAAKEADGAGLGLYISDYFMKGMQGKLLVENGENGLRVTVLISLSGTI